MACPGFYIREHPPLRSKKITEVSVPILKPPWLVQSVKKHGCSVMTVIVLRMIIQ
jgi:hypothetical protein